MATAIATEDLQGVCVMDGRVNYDQQSTQSYMNLTMHKRWTLIYYATVHAASFPDLCHRLLVLVAFWESLGSPWDGHIF